MGYHFSNPEQFRKLEADVVPQFLGASSSINTRKQIGESSFKELA